KLMQTVLDEAKINLSKVKDSLTIFSQNNEERDQLKPIPALLEQVQGSLMILSLESAANLLALTNNYIRKDLIKETIPPSLDDMNNLADAISSLEYYMESLMGSWGQPEAILAVAEQSLQALGINTGETAERVEDVSDIEDIQVETPAKDIIENNVFSLDDIDSEESIELDSGLDLSLESNEFDNDSFENALDVSDDISLDDISFDLTEATLSDEDEEEIILDDIALNDISLDEGLSFDIESDVVAHESLEDVESILEIQDDTITAPPAPVIEIDATQPPPSKPDAVKEPSLLDDTIDDEIIEIFMEEAEEAYETISEHLPVWVANTANDEPLKEIRRAYHTLKGSGRLVGATDLGEFAWAFENMLNRVLDNTIKASPELLELMDLGNKALLELFELFKVNAKPGKNILVLMAHADALSQGKSIDLNGLANTEAELENEMSLDLDLDESIASASEVDDIIELTDFEVPVEVEEEITLADFEEPVLIDEAVDVPDEDLLPVDIDPVLLEIYRKEVAVHIATLKEYIRSWHDGVVTPEVSLLRALHTLTGSSRTTGVESLAVICSTFEHYVNHLKDNEYNFPQVALTELDETISLIERTIACLDQAGASLPEHEILLSHIKALPKEFESTPEVASATSKPATEAPLADYDEELLEIFLEEGTEILDETDQVILDWVANPDEREHVEELQRQLHTLKGGARMAGITELGDLGHSIESLLTAVVDGHMKPSKPMFELVQRAQDRLVKMLELVQNHKGLTAATDLINEVDLILKNRGEIDDFDFSEDLSPIDESGHVAEVIETHELPNSAASEIPELEKLEEELRLEIEGSVSIPDLDIPEVE
ncbi:MAG: Hpt domain-containing protein, partial [Gammaproteobacteria bacterium]|nr:Hpt domain-containing protein [Gammaproteobacteria bacterium]